MDTYKLDGVITDCLNVAANPELGFNFPFKIIIPKNVCENSEIVYVCNLPYDESERCNTFDEMIELAKQDMGSIDMMHIHLCLEKGHSLVIPIIPRTKEFRPNFLGKDCFKNDFSVLKDFKFKDDLYRYENLADQHKAIMEYAMRCLSEVGIIVDDKVIIAGYSEGSKFASHFSILHPEIIKAVIAGGTGGVMSMPITHIGEYEFKYPLGVADVPSFDFDAFKKISFFYYIGEDDKSDSAIPKFEPYVYKNENGEVCILRDECGNATPFIDENGQRNFILDSDGNYMAMFNLFSDEEVNAISKTLGVVTQERFKKQEEVYKSMGLRAMFKMYPGNHRTIFDNTTKPFEDVDNFIASIKVESEIKLK